MLLLIVGTFLVSASAQQFMPTGKHTVPRGCNDNCNYIAEWMYMDDGSDMIEFTISAKVPRGFWAGIAFSKDTKMINSDAVVGWVNSDTPVLSDRYLTSQALIGVEPDNTPRNVNLKSGTYNNGMLMFKFTRSRTTTDPKDESLDRCLYFLYAWGGIGLPGSLIGKHSAVDKSDRMICVGKAARQISGGGESAGGKEDVAQRPVQPSLFACSVVPQVPFTTNDGKGRQMFNVGETVTYTCIEGYETEDTRQKLCVGAGVWGGIDPECRPIGSARRIPSSGTDLPTVGSTASCLGVQCPSNSQCQITGRQSACICISGFQPTPLGCAPEVVQTVLTPVSASVLLSCGPPPTIPFTTNSGTGRLQFAIGAVVAYQCNLGYTASGLMQKSCQLGGTWTSANPICTAASGPAISGSAAFSFSICDSVTCQKNSQCIEQGGFATCMCNPGYEWAPNEKCVATSTGVSVAVKDVCAGIQCPGNKECYPQSGFAHTCRCMPGYEENLTGVCVTMTNPQIVTGVCNNVNCQPNAICKEYSGVAICECMTGYIPDSDQNCILQQTFTVDACNGVTCPINSRCMTINNAVICDCFPQYEWRDGQCVGMVQDMCKTRICPPYSECVIVGNAPACKCKTGYTENLLKLCVDAQASACTGVNCPLFSNCVTRDNKAFCDCIEGHRYNSKGECEATDTCFGKNCKDNEYCMEGACKCKKGYVLENVRCVVKKIVETAVTKVTCVGFTCGKNGVCLVINGKRRCECKAGFYKGSNGRCMEARKIVNICQDVLCGPTRTCVNKEGKAACTCKKDYAETSNGLCIAVTGCQRNCGVKRKSGCSCHSGCAREYNCCSDYWTFCHGVAAYLNTGSRSNVSPPQTVVRPPAVIS